MTQNYKILITFENLQLKIKVKEKSDEQILHVNVHFNINYSSIL
jgi:hypothetical protein